MSATSLSPTRLTNHWQPSRQLGRLKQPHRSARQTTLWLSGHVNALYDRLRPRFNSLAVIETERNYRSKTMSSAKSGGDETAKRTQSPPMVSGHSHSIVLSHVNALIYQRYFLLHIPKNRIPDPSENRSLELKGKFRRFEICAVSTTIGINRSIFF